MINTFIAYDNHDGELGDYFEESHADIVSVIGMNVLISNISIDGLGCTEKNINLILGGLNGSRFIFVVLSHGNCDEFVSNEAFISVANAPNFVNSFLYSTACSTGKNLGNLLIGKGCSSFVGYEEEVQLTLDYAKVFYACENYGVKSFLSNEETIEISFNRMIAYYNSEIDRLVAGNIDELIAASYLVNNKDCLVLLGNRDLTRSDFNNI